MSPTPERAEHGGAERWSHRVRFVPDDSGDIVPQWRYPELVPARIRMWFEARVRDEGPSPELIEEFECALVDTTAELAGPAAALESILDREGFRPWPPAGGRSPAG
jgi:hypothetical protein